MPSCSVHHCVLVLLTLTLTTDPGKAVCEFPIYAKLHQSVTLPCEAQCSGRAKWSLDSNRDVVFARCDQTSCTSVQQGFNMSHDQYKRDDLSLIITNPDYSMRETYTCECEFSDYATWRLRISTVLSAVHVQTEGDLKLDLSVPESVEVIYRGSVLSDDVQICTVTDRTLQCNTEYTPRTSLSNSELTLRDVQRSESGTYTIRNLDHKEDIRVYAVSVSGLTTGETAGIVIGVLLFLVLLIAGVVYYMKRKTEQKRREVKSDMKAVDDLMAQAELKPPVEQIAALQQVEEKIKALEQKHREDSEHKEHVTLFCKRKRSELVKSDMEAVDDLIKQALLKPRGEMKAALQQVEEKIKALEQKYRWDSEHSELITLFCNNKDPELELCWGLSRIQMETLDPVKAKVNSDMIEVDELIKQAPHKPPGEMEVALQMVLEKMVELRSDYTHDKEYSNHIFLFTFIKSSELYLYKVLYLTENTVTAKIKSQMVAVGDLVKQVKCSTPVKLVEAIQKALRATYDLQLEYRGNTEYSQHITRFSNIQQSELNAYIKFYGAKTIPVQLEKQKLVKQMEEVWKNLQDLKREALEQNHSISGEQIHDKCFWVQSHLLRINTWCSVQKEELKMFKQQFSDEVRNANIIHNMETHLDELKQWYESKIKELKECRQTLDCNLYPRRPINTGEKIPLLDI